MFCLKCGNKLVEGSSFCQDCGEKLIVDSTATSTKTNNRNYLIKSAIGKNSDYYLKQFEKIDKGEKSFNICAFFFAPIVVLYRKQYSYFKKLLLPVFITLLIQMLLSSYAVASFSFELLSLVPFTGLIIWVYAITTAILCGLGFNKNYKAQLYNADENELKKLNPSVKTPIIFLVSFALITVIIQTILVGSMLGTM